MPEEQFYDPETLAVVWKSLQAGHNVQEGGYEELLSACEWMLPMVIAHLGEHGIGAGSIENIEPQILELFPAIATVIRHIENSGN